MKNIYTILTIAAPLLLSSTGALVTEHAGCMALFLDGIINLSAFLCFAFTTFFSSPIYGCIFSIILCSAFIFAFALIVENLNANKFLASLSLNLLATSLTSFFSSILFNTRGVLTNSIFTFSASKTRLFTTILALAISAIAFSFLKFSKLGLYIRISGSDADVLRSKGICVKKIHLLSWTLATSFASTVGCILSLRISSFVPNIASGIGWTSLVIVFLGKKNTAAIIAAVLVLASAQFGANNLQNFQMFSNIPKAFLLALPYISALVLILIVPQKNHRR